MLHLTVVASKKINEHGIQYNDENWVWLMKLGLAASLTLQWVSGPPFVIEGWPPQWTVLRHGVGSHTAATAMIAEVSTSSHPTVAWITGESQFSRHESLLSFSCLPAFLILLLYPTFPGLYSSILVDGFPIGGSYIQCIYIYIYTVYIPGERHGSVSS